MMVEAQTKHTEWYGTQDKMNSSYLDILLETKTAKPFRTQTLLGILSLWNYGTTLKLSQLSILDPEL